MFRIYHSNGEFKSHSHHRMKSETKAIYEYFFDRCTKAIYEYLKLIRYGDHSKFLMALFKMTFWWVRP